MLLLCKGFRRHRLKAVKPKKPERIPDIYQIDITMVEEGHETCLTEGERFVGTTAKFDAVPDPQGVLLRPELQIIPLRPELRLEGLDPDFEGRKESLVWASLSTCSIGVKRHGAQAVFASGTAFFVGPTTLLTAGHVVHDTRDKIIAEEPGKLKATYFIEELFDDPSGDNAQKFECKLIKTLYGSADISVLEVVGPYKSENFIQVSQQVLPPDSMDIVDILGYPGAYDPREVKNMHPSKHVNIELVHDVEALFPRRELVLSHGMVKSGGVEPQYRVSTVIGMSGGPVVVDGKVIGIHTGIVGNRRYAHVNYCVSFECPIVWNLLRKCALTREIVENGIAGGPAKGRWSWIKRGSDAVVDAST